MLTITNSFHGTSARINAQVGDYVSRSVFNRVRRALCPATCKCGRGDGSRDSAYFIAEPGYGSTPSNRIYGIVRKAVANG